MGRRGSREGSIYQRSDGLWVGAAHVGWEGGKRRRKVVYAKTRADVAARLRTVQGTIDSGLPVADERLTTGQWLDWWSTEVLPSGRVKAATVENYRHVIDHYVKPSIGRVRLVKLGPKDVQAMLRSLDERGLS